MTERDVDIEGLDRIGTLAANLMEELEGFDLGDTAIEASITAVGLIAEISVEGSDCRATSLVRIDCTDDRSWAQRGLFEAALDVIPRHTPIETLDGA